jgi:hypothetical protein
MRHDGVAPEFHRLYRCHVCRLELMLDEATNRMQVPPLPDAADGPPPPPVGESARKAGPKKKREARRDG